MKLFNSIFVVCVLTIVLVSCDDDDTTPVQSDVNVDLLVGEWELSESTMEAMVVSTFGGQTISATSEGMGSNYNYSILFNEDNTTTADGFYDFTVTISIQETTNTQIILIEDTMTEGDWSLSEDQLTISGFTTAAIFPDSALDQVQEARSFTITAIDETTLILTSDLQDSIPEDLPNESEVNLSGNSIITFTRVN